MQEEISSRGATLEEIPSDHGVHAKWDRIKSKTKSIMSRYTAQQLLAAGLDINKGSADRQCTALMTACYYGHSACVEQLLKAGADVTLKVRCLSVANALLAPHTRSDASVIACTQDANGETALDYSSLKMGATIGHTKCRNLIQPLVR